MCKKVVFIFVMIIACALTGCTKEGIVSNTDSSTASISSLIIGKEQGEQLSEQTDKSILAEKYNVDNDGNVTNFLDTITVPYKSGENYEIYTDDGQWCFRYVVKDSSGIWLDEGYTGSKVPKIYHKNGLLVVYLPGSFVSYSERYYDIPTGRVSPFFSRPIAMSDKLVAFFILDHNLQIKLVVQDIFDRSVYYTEIRRDFSDFVIKSNQYKGEFLDNNTKLKITYPVNDKEEPVTEEILLD